ncbi:MAG: phage DNA encapsidation protein [Clostridia bacterium]|nr:phage DNA encapsidation protein [Clostridia bacterium]
MDKSVLTEYKKAQKKRDRIEKIKKSEWYGALRSILGITWAMFIFLLGGREVGKSYAVMDFFCNQFKKKNRPFTWMRLTDASAGKLLSNNAAELVDADLRRKYNLDLYTRNETVYHVISRDKAGKVKKKKMFCRVLSLSTYYNNKGQALFDKDFLNDPEMYYNICLDEMNREQVEKNSFDILIAFKNQLENLIRTTKKRVRIICIGNTLDEASDILSAFAFIPQGFGRFYLKRKRAVVENIEPSEAYVKRRTGSAADILSGGNKDSSFTNDPGISVQNVTKIALVKPYMKIVFSKNLTFTLWNDNIITKYNGEYAHTVPMRPYLDEPYNANEAGQIIALFDAQQFRYRDLITAVQFNNALKQIKPRR